MCAKAFYCFGTRISSSWDISVVSLKVTDFQKIERGEEILKIKLLATHLPSLWAEELEF